MTKKDMVVQECQDLEVTFSDYENYSPEEVKQTLDELILQAEAQGLTKCFIRFQSNMTPYEGYLDYPSAYPCGYRKMNESEIAQEVRENKILDVSKKLGIPYYQAVKVVELEEIGVITNGRTQE
jgi:hypothetical protein